MSALQILAWVTGLVVIIGVSMWADQETKVPFWVILALGLISSVLWGQVIVHL